MRIEGISDRSHSSNGVNYAQVDKIHNMRLRRAFEASLPQIEGAGPSLTANRWPAATGPRQLRSDTGAIQKQPGSIGAAIVELYAGKPFGTA